MSDSNVLVAAVSDGEEGNIYFCQIRVQYQVQYLGRARQWRPFESWRTSIGQIEKLRRDEFLRGKKVRVVRRLISETEEVNEWPPEPLP